MSPKEPQTLLLLPLSSSCSSFTQMAIGNGYQENTVTEDLENPLLTEHEKVDESKKGGEKGSIGMVLLSTAVATCGSFEFGLCVGYSAPTQPAIREDLHLSLAEYSVFGSIVAVGAMAGAITSGKISDSIGRKWGMRLSAGCCIVGWLAIYFSMGALVLDMGRFLTGCGIGVFSSVVPVFIAEIAPTNLRGGLTTLNQAKTGKHREFEAALRKLRGEDADVSREEAEIQTYIETLRSLPISQTLDLLDAKYVRSVTVDWGWFNDFPTIWRMKRNWFLCKKILIVHDLQGYQEMLELQHTLLFRMLSDRYLFLPQDLPNTFDGYCWEFGDLSELVWYLGSFLYFQLSHELEFNRCRNPRPTVEIGGQVQKSAADCRNPRLGAVIRGQLQKSAASCKNPRLGAVIRGQVQKSAANCRNPQPATIIRGRVQKSAAKCSNPRPRVKVSGHNLRYGCNGFLQLALELLGTMRLEGFEPDFVTWKIAMDVYCKMGQCDEAWKIFEQIEEANIISWTTLMYGYSRIGKA
ncbi:hypothetical protein RHMOL_Rhmol02G0015800 [Rhododendron molle]|uniref:Uncharacterized protein n=1 Tax=Rhododendron molle TaxID=49168 RepID=A0ACC0PLU4_RHOML|nr:hypothetical protein RHMOL_Rhmol02G0015800 [Rhododendron molle]